MSIWMHSWLGWVSPRPIKRDTENGKTRVLLVLNDMAWFWSHRLPLAKGIIDKGWRVGIAGHDASSDTGLADRHMQPFDLPELRSSKNPIEHLSIVWAIYQHIKKHKPAVVHGITIKYAFYVGLATRITPHVAVVFTIAGLGSLYSSDTRKMRIARSIVTPFLKIAFSGKNRFVIFQNPDDMSLWLSQKIVRSENCTLIKGSGVDLMEFPYRPEPNTDNETIVLFASRLLIQKGILDFIKVAESLRKMNGASFRFVVAGNTIGNDSRYISEEVLKRAQQAGVIEWLGSVSNVRDVIRQSSIVVLPSYYGEGLPKILLEAAASGRPMVAYNVPGSREIVRDNVNGYLVPCNDLQQLADAIKKLALDRSLRQTFGLAARSTVEDEFHTDLVVGNTLAFYDEVLARTKLARTSVG